MLLLWNNISVTPKILDTTPRGASNAFPLVPGKIIKISSDGTVSDFASDFTEVGDMIFDNAGNLYISDFDHGGGVGGKLVRITPEGTRSIILSGYYDLTSMVFVPKLGNIMAFDTENRRFVTVTPEGNVHELSWDFGGEVLGADYGHKLAWQRLGRYCN